MAAQIRLNDADVARAEDRDDGTLSVAADLAYLRLSIVNVLFFGVPGAGDRNWVLIDAGLGVSRPVIEQCAQKRFGGSARPSVIILTHGHFDHVGSVEELAEAWDAPVWSTGTHNGPGSYLAVQNNGEFVIYSVGGDVRWWAGLGS